MEFQRGDVVLIPFPYTDLTANKTRPAVVISGPVYHALRTELLLAYVSSQIVKATPPIDFLLRDWRQAGLLKPSFVRPKIAAIEPALVVHRVGQLSAQDLGEVDGCLRRALALTESVVSDIVQEVDFLTQSPHLLQALAERTVTALAALAKAGNSAVDLDRIRRLL
jgi:mRNA interferase MazF